MDKRPHLAPELHVKDWLNTKQLITLESLRGKVVLIEAFQMLCPGCVSHGLPQASKVAQLFNPDDVAVLGLHTVFEHHEAQGTKTALEAFLHEYRIPFPVGIDVHENGVLIPKTMTAYQLRGTPSLILIDQKGFQRRQHFGQVDDMLLGAEIMSLLKETSMPAEITSEESNADSCDENGCSAQGMNQRIG